MSNAFYLASFFFFGSFMCLLMPSAEFKTSPARNSFEFIFLAGMPWMKRPSLSLNLGETPGPLVSFLFCCFAAISFNKLQLVLHPAVRIYVILKNS